MSSAAPAGCPDKVALTFDDGPSAEWTPQDPRHPEAEGRQGDVLHHRRQRREQSAPGAAHPRRGPRDRQSHLHPSQLGEASAEVAKLEINATQRLVEALTGRSMRLFRPPYFGDAEPTTPNEIVPVKLAQQLGYVTVGLRVDPDDWQEPSADLIVQRIMERMADTNPETRGQIVLLHDAGGDREQTVAALPRDHRRSCAPRASRSCRCRQLAGWTLDQVMPPVPPERPLHAASTGTCSSPRAGCRPTMHLAVSRSRSRLVLRASSRCAGWRFGAVTRPCRHHPCRRATASTVTVLIPAYNEAKVIAASVDGILRAAHAKLEVIVIDDGSTDGTSDVVRDALRDDPRVTLITRRTAARRAPSITGLALRTARSSSLSMPIRISSPTPSRASRAGSATKRSARSPATPRSATAINLLTRWQALEYITAQNLERRALASLERITVVPGRGRRLAPIGIGQARRLPDRHPRRGSGPDHCHTEGRLPGDLRSGCRRLDRGARHRRRACEAALPLVVRHIAMPVEARRRHAASSLRRARSVALPQAWLFQILLALISPFVDLLLIVQLVAVCLRLSAARRAVRSDEPRR